jgi:hypothetical protein
MLTYCTWCAQKVSGLPQLEMERRLEGRKFRQKYYIGCMRDASREGNFAKILYPVNGDVLETLRGKEISPKLLYWMYERRLEGRKFRQKYYMGCMRDASREGNFAKNIILDV